MLSRLYARSLKSARRRSGFTLVELLVATALTMLIMAIIATAFQTAMDSLSHLRSAGELQDRLRSSGEKLRQDLQSPHFEDESIKGGKLSEVRHDSNPSFRATSGFFHIEQGSESFAEHSVVPLNPRDYSTRAVNHGLMFTVQLPGNSRQTIFTAPRVGNSSGNQGLDDKHDNIVANPGTTYGSRWAVVSWFLIPTTDRTTGSVAASNQTLYNLHRRVKLLAEVEGTFIDPSNPDSQNYFFDNRQFLRSLVTAPSTYSAPVANPNFGRVFTAKDRAVWDANVRFDRSVVAVDPTDNTRVIPRFDRPTDMYSPVGDGSDIVMSNILSFEVKSDYSDVPTTLVKTAGPAIASLYPRRSVRTADLAIVGSLYANLGVTVDNYNANNKDFPFDDLPVLQNPPLPPVPPRAQSSARTYDSGASGGTEPLTMLGAGLSPSAFVAVSTSVAANPVQPIRVKAIQIKLRIYDPKNKTTRQQTIVQEM